MTSDRERELLNKIADLEATVADLRSALGQSDTRIEVTFRLAPNLAKALGLLCAVPVASPEMIRDRVALSKDYKNTMHRLRKHMHNYGIIIHSQQRVGYWLEPEMKKRVQEMVAKNSGVAA